MSKPKNQRKVNSTLEQEVQLWQTTFDALNESVFILDLRQKILQCNKATVEFFQKSSSQEVIGQSCCELFHNKSQPVEWCPMVIMMESNKRESSVAQIGDKWAEISADPIFDNENKLIGAVHLIKDITQNKLTEIKLRESEEKYHGLFDSFPHFIGLVDLEGVLIECNVAINKFLSRHTKDDLIGLNFIKILSIIDKNKNLVPKFKELMQQAILDGKLKSFEFKIHRSRGDILWLKIEGSIILIGGQKFIQFIIQDITTRKITEEKLKMSELKLQDRVKELGSIYKLSKLIDNPNLTPESLIYGALELIPPALQFTELAKVRIQYEDKTYTSFDFKKSEWKITAADTINGEEITIEVCYLENKSFLKEEYDLIREIITRLKSCLEEREAEKKLNESEERYRLIYENANDLIRVLNDRFEFEYLNENVHKKILGYSKEDLIGQTHLPFLHPEDRRHAIRSTVRNLKKGEGSYQARFKDKSGIFRWFEFSGTAFSDSKGDKKILSIARDIDKRKKTELRLKKSEEKYRDLVNSVPDLLLEVDLKGKFTYASPQLYDIFGFTPTEILNKSMRKFIHPDDMLNVMEALKEAYKTKKDITVEYRTLHKDGHYVYASAKGSLLENGRFYGVVRDISERKIAELKLRESEEKYRLISETAYDLIAVLNKKFKYEYTNENALQKILGYTKEEVLDKSILKFVHPDDLNLATKALFEGFKRGQGEAEVRIIHKDGHLVWLEVRGQTFVDKDGELKALLISRDFTERKIAIERLRQSEERYRLISQNADENLFIFDMNMNLIYNDTRVPNILGYTYEEMRKLKLTDYNVASSLKIALKAYREELRNERKKIGDPKRIRTFEVEQIHKDGSILNVETRFTFLRDKSGTATGILGLSRNISKRKQAEQKLKESEEKFRLIAEQTLVGISIIQNGKLKYINRAFGEIHEYTVEEMYERTMDDLINNIHPDDVHLVREKKILRETGDKRIHHLLFRVKTKSGKLKWLDNTSRVIQYNGGDALLSTIVDITERKQAEQKLRESEERYRLISQNADENLFIFDMNLNVIYHDPNVPNILGYTNDEISKLKLTDYNEPSSLKILLKAYKEELRNERKKIGDPKRIRMFEIDQIHKDGSIVNVEVKFTFLRDEKGIAKGIISITRDISKRKQAEQKLRESEEKYRLISETAYDLIGMLNRKFKYEYINENAFKQILGYSSSEILGKSAL
ncbi:MAG: PAS domain-containing protein, partial [Promethearchaeota archaeon]